MERRSFLLCSAAALAGATFPSLVRANVPTAYSFDVAPPLDGGDAFIKWMQANRGENPKYLAQRWARFQVSRVSKDLRDERNKRAYLFTPREEFVCSAISGAPTIARSSISASASPSPARISSRRMTTTIDVKLGEKVLEIGTGSGYQSAYLANLTEKVWSIEIIKPLAERTRGAL